MTEQNDVSSADEENMPTESAALDETEVEEQAPTDKATEDSNEDETPPEEQTSAGETTDGHNEDETPPEEQASAGESTEGPNEGETTVEKQASAGETTDSPGQDETTPAPAAAVIQAPRPERPEVTALRAAQEKKEVIEGKIIGWNNGGLHVVVNGVTAFCPRSEIELGSPKGPEAYLDKTFPFLVLRVQKRGRRIVVSRRALLQGDRDIQIDTLRQAMRAGDVLEGTVSSVTDFGAFVDLGGIDGLVHVSEISRTRVAHASEVTSQGESVKVRVLKISDDGSRVSLSMKALEPDPWDGIEDRFPAGEMVTGTVERTAEFGAFIEIAPGLTGLLPTSAMNLPRDASAARVYQPGKEVSVLVLSIDQRRQRISLALEGSQAEGTRADLKSYRDQQSSTESSFGSLAAAFEKARKK